MLSFSKKDRVKFNYGSRRELKIELKKTQSIEEENETLKNEFVDKVS